MPILFLLYAGIVLLYSNFATTSPTPAGTSPKNRNEKKVIFLPTWGHEVLQTEKYYSLSGNKDSLRFETIAFYVSNLAFLKNGNPVFIEKNSYHLINFGDTAAQQINLPHLSGSPDEISFDIGMDSLTNTSGAMGGDLDPTKGMYWTWQSGYIHIKIEGQSPLCPTRKNRFQFHLGGYKHPFPTLQHIRLPIKNNTTSIAESSTAAAAAADTTVIRIDLAEFMRNIDLQKQNSLMIPGQDAKQLAYQFGQIFSIGYYVIDN